MGYVLRVTLGSVMSDFDYVAPAELFIVQGRGGLKYRRFPRAAEAIRYPSKNFLPICSRVRGSRLKSGATMPSRSAL